MIAEKIQGNLMKKKKRKFPDDNSLAYLIVVASTSRENFYCSHKM